MCSQHQLKKGSKTAKNINREIYHRYLGLFLHVYSVSYKQNLIQVKRRDILVKTK